METAQEEIARVETTQEEIAQVETAQEEIAQEETTQEEITQEETAQEVQATHDAKDTVSGIDTTVMPDAPNPDIEAEMLRLKLKEEELEKWQKELTEREIELSSEQIRLKQENAALTAKESMQKQMLDNRISDAIEKAVSELDSRLKEKNKEFEEKNQQMEADMAARRTKLEDEMKARRTELENELLDTEKRRLGELDNEIKMRTADVTSREKAVTDREKSVDEKEKKLEKIEAEQEKEKESIDREKRRLARREDRLDEREADIDKEIKTQYQEEIRNKDTQISVKEQELQKLRNQLKNAMAEIESVVSFKKAYGDKDPNTLIALNNQLEGNIKSLRDEIASMVTIDEHEALQENYKNLEYERIELLKENAGMRDKVEKATKLELDNKQLESFNKALSADNEELKNLLDAKNDEIKRLSSPEGRLADHDARVAAIMTGDTNIDMDKIGGFGEKYDSRRADFPTEIKWLDGILEKCNEYGISFKKRILYAFHTSLKINEWSTITVLAGVSGTGKSELPRLYANFGGLNFCSASVQPNWDSQESMLGFFNSIDNQFQPEDLLKFLVRCTENELLEKKQKDEKTQGGAQKSNSDIEYIRVPNDLQEYMSIILLDEMNLAHVEHYFAEFLSKLELRRGRGMHDLPKIDVKLGAGVEPYKLELSRTLLWTGTMNQDETTKSLSDKVLDRGVVINFPRPTKLVSRGGNKTIKSFIDKDRPKLHKETWRGWTAYKSDFSDEQKKEIEVYRNIVEEINNALELVGRAIGHRVWQSIELYIANYPTVMQAKEKSNGDLTPDLQAAMRIAFEDQIVQKIMPKLRGIETRDKRGISCLDKIENLLLENHFTSLKDDFDFARNGGYGQFIWNSAKYLDEDIDKAVEAK